MDKLTVNEGSVKKAPLSQNQNFIENSSSPQFIKLLIVEDNYIARKALEEMLAQLGYCADFAEDAKTALAMYSPQYQLILVDIELPDFDGLEVAKIIRAVERKKQLKNTPIIAITSHHDEPEYHVKCLIAGMNGCSNKPTSTQIKKWIQKYLQPSNNALKKSISQEGH